jgi:hypothetical protein
MWRFAQFAVASAAGHPRRGIQPGSTILSSARDLLRTSVVEPPAPSRSTRGSPRPPPATPFSSSLNAPHSAASHVAIELGITGPLLPYPLTAAYSDVIGVAHAQVASISDIAIAGPQARPSMTLGAFGPQPSLRAE